MKYEDIIRNLNHQDVEQRLGSVRVLGLVEETEALVPLRNRHKSENNDQVKAAIDWAGKRIFAAHQRGYTTIKAIFQEFRVLQEIENMEDPTEKNLMQQLETKFISDMAAQAQSSAMKNGIMSAVGGAMVGGAMGAMSASMGMMTSSSLGEKRPEIGKQRIPAQIPATIPIEMWIKRLKSAQTGADRRKAVMQLLEFNNPDALPHLVEVWLNEPLADVKEYIEKSTRTIYLKMRYWEFTQNGSIDAAVDEMVKARFKK